MLESPPPPSSLPPSPSPPHPPPPPLPLPTAPGLRHSRLYDITFLTPSGARSTAGTLLLGPRRFAAASVAAEFESRRRGKSFAQVWWGHGGGCGGPGDGARRRQGGLLNQVEPAAWATPAQTPRGRVRTPRVPRAPAVGAAARACSPGTWTAGTRSELPG